MGAEQIFIRSVQEKDHRRRRTLKNTEELKKEPKPITGAFFESYSVTTLSSYNQIYG